MKWIFDYEFRPNTDCGIAAAVLGAGALSAGASIYGSSKAADAQQAAANASIANQQQMFGQVKNLLQPFIGAGANTTNTLQNWLNPSGGGPLGSLLSLTTPGANMNDVLSQTPGYQFTKDQGLQAVNNALAARGLGGSAGAVTKGAANYVEGLAGTTWSNVVNALQNVFSSGSGAMQNLVNSGVAAGSAVGGVGSNTANAISNSLIGSGNAQAAAANAAGGAIGNFGNSISTASLLGNLSGNNGGLYGIGNAPATGVGAPNDLMSNIYAMTQGINPWG